VIGMIAVGLNPVIDSTMASWLGKGSVSVLFYADKLYMIPVTFLIAGLMVTILSYWSERFYEFGHKRLREDVKKACQIAGTISFILMVFLITTSQFIVVMAFGRETISQEILSEIRIVWICYMLGLVPYIIAQILVQANIVIKNTKPLMVGAFGMNLVNILFNYVFMKFYNTAGIAISTSIVYCLAMIFFGLLFMFNERIKE